METETAMALSNSYAVSVRTRAFSDVMPWPSIPGFVAKEEEEDEGEEGDETQTEPYGTDPDPDHHHYPPPPTTTATTIQWSETFTVPDLYRDTADVCDGYAGKPTPKPGLNFPDDVESSFFNDAWLPLPGIHASDLTEHDLKDLLPVLQEGDLGGQYDFEALGG